MVFIYRDRYPFSIIISLVTTAEADIYLTSYSAPLVAVGFSPSHSIDRVYAHLHFATSPLFKTHLPSATTSFQAIGMGAQLSLPLTPQPTTSSRDEEVGANLPAEENQIWHAAIYGNDGEVKRSWEDINARRQERGDAQGISP